MARNSDIHPAASAILSFDPRTKLWTLTVKDAEGFDFSVKRSDLETFVGTILPGLFPHVVKKVERIGKYTAKAYLAKAPITNAKNHRISVAINGENFYLPKEADYISTETIRELGKIGEDRGLIVTLPSGIRQSVQDGEIFTYTNGFSFESYRLETR